MVVLGTLWLIAVAGEIWDARLLETDSVNVAGRIEAPHWEMSRRGGLRLVFEAAWSFEGQEHRGQFNLPEVKALPFVSRDGTILESRIEMRCARSKPQVAALAIQPPDPVWVTLIIACVGLCILVSVGWYLTKTGFWNQR